MKMLKLRRRVSTESVDNSDTGLFPKLSRRTLLKTAGVAALGTLAVGFPISKLASVPIAADSADLRQARAIAAASPLAYELLTELKQKGYALDLNRSVLAPTFGKNDVLGLVLMDTRAGLLRERADVVLTIDLKAGKVTGAQYITAGVTSGAVAITTVQYSRGRRQEEQKNYALSTAVSKGAGALATATNSALQSRSWYLADRMANVCQCDGGAIHFSRELPNLYYNA